MSPYIPERETPDTRNTHNEVWLNFFQNHQTPEDKNPFQSKLFENYSEIKSVSQTQTWIRYARNGSHVLIRALI